MKLNHDCVRTLLLYLEEHLPLGDFLDIHEVKIDKYTSDEIVYATCKLEEAKYISANIDLSLVGHPDVLIFSITWDGHQFLDNIRDDGIWKDTKKVLTKFSSTSLGIANSVASQIITTVIKSQLGLM